MTSGYLFVLAFLCAALVALLIVWWYARRVKSDLDISPVVGGAPAVVDFPSERAAPLRGLSAEPILIKQSRQGVQVQIEHRPMMPLMAFVGADVSTALSEAAVAVSARFGVEWTVLLSVGDDERVSVQRLA